MEVYAEWENGKKKRKRKPASTWWTKKAKRGYRSQLTEKVKVKQTKESKVEKKGKYTQE